MRLNLSLWSEANFCLQLKWAQHYELSSFLCAYCHLLCGQSVMTPRLGKAYPDFIGSQYSIQSHKKIFHTIPIEFRLLLVDSSGRIFSLATVHCTHRCCCCCCRRCCCFGSLSMYGFDNVFYIIPISLTSASCVAYLQKTGNEMVQYRC